MFIVINKNVYLFPTGSTVLHLKLNQLTGLNLLSEFQMGFKTQLNLTIKKMYLIHCALMY